MSAVAAVDVGTNSVRLLVAEPGDPLHQRARHMTITRLGRGIDATGRFDDAALLDTLECLSGYARIWEAAGVHRVRIAATSAVRDAADRERFFEGVRARVGVEAEVLTGDEEAALAFRGATSLVTGDPPFLIVDIGGGSTEFIVGTDHPEGMISRQLGCVRLTERCLPSDPPTPPEIARAEAVIAGHLEAVAAAVAPARARTLVGVAGTVTTLAALHLGLPAYEPDRIHGTRVPTAAVEELTAQLAGMPARARARLGPMAPGREDVIVGGALILRDTLRAFGFADVLVSEADILDGLALGLLGDGQAPTGS